VAAIVPLISYFFLPIKAAFAVSLGVTLLALIGVGAYSNSPSVVAPHNVWKVPQPVAGPPSTSHCPCR